MSTIALENKSQQKSGRAVALLAPPPPRSLIVVVPIAPTKFRDNLLKFTLYAIIIYKVRDKRCHLRRHALIQHNFFHEIRTPPENKHARIVIIG